MLITRILSAVLLIPVVLAALYLGGFWAATLVALFAVLAVIEFYQISARLGAHPYRILGVALTIVLSYAPLLPDGARVGAGAFIIVLAAMMIDRVLRQKIEGFLLDWASTLAGAAYVGGMLSHFVLLRGLPGGPYAGIWWVALAIGSTWVGDTAAYFVGSTMGRHPFFPKVSPRKTVEGAIGGLVFGTATAVAIGVPLLHIAWPLAILLGVLVSMAGTVGDLAESLLKRQANVKDSGKLIPGHGGALDRVDSLLFAAVLVYYFAIWVVRAH